MCYTVIKISKRLFMNKTVIFSSTIILLIVYWLIGFINGLNEEIDVKHGVKEKNIIIIKENYMRVNSNGDEVLVLTSLKKQEKKHIWNNSYLKLKMLKLFPHFEDMKLFIKKHIEDDGTIKDEIISNLENIEFEYVGGKLTGEDAKKAIINF